MIGSKVFQTYKRKRQSLRNNFEHGNRCHNSFSDDLYNTTLATPDKHDKLTTAKASEKQEENSTVRFFKMKLLFSLINCLWIASSLLFYNTIFSKACQVPCN